MNKTLKQSTAVVIQFGPFVDKDDGITLETGLVSALDHATTGIKISKNGGTQAVRNATVTASVYDAHGFYKVTLDTTDTGTAGSIKVMYTDPATCLPVWDEYKIVPANVYDAMIAGTDKLQVDTVEVGGTSQTAGDVAALIATLTAYVDTEIAAIKAKTDNLPADPADASDIAGSFSTVNATLATIVGYLDTEIAAIKAKTDNLPADPADASDIAASFSSIASTLTTITGYLDTEVAAIKAKTDNLPSDPADQSALEAAITAAQTAILAKLLKYFQLALRKDSAIATDNAAELTAINADGGSGAGGYVSTTDSLQAVRDQVDDAYYADIKLTRDEVNDRDEYTVVWFKNGQPVTSGLSGTPTIRVYDRAGSNLIATTNMTEVITGVWKYNEAANLVTIGDAVIAHVAATIDSVARTDRAVLTRDAEA